MSKDPYVYDDTNVLKNLANIKEQHKLDDYETTMVNLGIIIKFILFFNICKILQYIYIIIYIWIFTHL